MERRRAELQDQISERAARDEAFRQELMTDPKEALGREYGIRIPESLELKVLETTPSMV